MNQTAQIEMAVIKLSPFVDIERPLLWLAEKDVDNPRLLPIGIRDFEAVSIQMVLEGDNPPRPLPQDLLFSMLQGLSLDLQKIVLQIAAGSLFTAELVLQIDGQTRRIDARPSDAVALGLRGQTPIFATADALDQASFRVADGEDIEEAIERFCTNEAQILPSPEQEGPELEEPVESLPEPEMDLLGQLRDKLEKAVLCEEYEEAARLRDEICDLVAKSKP